MPDNAHIIRAETLRREHDNNGSNGSSWKTTALGALWAVLLLVSGWVFSDSKANQAEIRTQIRALEASRSNDVERIARLEEALRHYSDALLRIESGVNEIRRGRYSNDR